MTHDEQTIAAVIEQHRTAGAPTQSTLRRIAQECSRLTQGDPFQVHYDPATHSVVATHSPRPIRVRVAEAPRGFIEKPAEAIPPVRVTLGAAT